MVETCHADATAQRSVLFVDDEPNVLQALERMLRPLRREYTMTFALGGSEALRALELSRFDVLVTDMLMPGMNGTELMEQVLRRHPEVIRIALSGHADRELVIRAIGLAHQYLSKPCDADYLKEKLSQAFRLKRLIDSEKLRSLVSTPNALPSVPALYADIMAEVEGRHPSAQRIGEIVSRDPAMTAKILQLINSAFFALRTSISDPGQAVQLLGLDTVRSLALTVQVFAHFESRDVSKIWQHSLRTAHGAATVARHMGLDHRGVSESFTAGLLHDAGKLVMASAFPEYGEIVRAATDEGADAEQAERKGLGGSHADVGAYLFGLWGLPIGIVEAVAWHHRPSESGCGRPCALTAVHTANAIDHERYTTTAGKPAIDRDYLRALGFDNMYEDWVNAVAAGDRTGS